ncbi:hypothetical protein COCSADRAFT_300227 [Bipolaris sorokiniana ND90Pr]|uniref:Uncharacterized protein n=1 Tax=Cochliobolus sativus (strain ND90Pr / ATCC 201652) TaxID=665912 RepID=M2TCY3_COCSN|nr:uncharacterized protein COCSADRAFT_300227 [Bipolaris sorokiniana ND90Pr]EMD66607.1 hypothetical protein COCSADRAFT_300227 [Bipolaris sorokiniana ND90Pr]
MRRGIHCPSPKHFGIRCFRLVAMVLMLRYVLVCSIPNSILLFHSAIFPCLSVSSAYLSVCLFLYLTVAHVTVHLAIQVHHSEEPWIDGIVLHIFKSPRQPSTQ